MSKRPSYSREFKLEAVRLLEAEQKPASELAHELGAPRNKPEPNSDMVYFTPSAFF